MNNKNNFPAELLELERKHFRKVALKDWFYNRFWLGRAYKALLNEFKTKVK